MKVFYWNIDFTVLFIIWPLCSNKIYNTIFFSYRYSSDLSAHPISVFNVISIRQDIEESIYDFQNIT